MSFFRRLIILLKPMWNIYKINTWVQISLGIPGGSAVKYPPASAGDEGSILGSERSPEKEMAIHSSILAWEIPWTEEPGELQWSWKRVRNDLATKSPPPPQISLEMQVKSSILNFFVPQTRTFYTPLSKGSPLIFFFMSVNLLGTYRVAAASYISCFLLSWLIFRFCWVTSEVIFSSWLCDY